MKNRFVAKHMLVTAMVAFSGVAFAGQDLDLAKSRANDEAVLKLVPLQAACGCKPSLVIGAGFKDKDDVNRISYAAAELATAATKYCAGGDKYKKAFCENIKTLQVDFAASPGPAVLAKPVLKMESNSMGYTGGATVSRVLDPLAG